MLIDILSTNNYVSFNIKIAEKLGLHTAIYISELTNINSKAIKKNKIDVNGFFCVDRKYMTSRTTLCEKEQKDIELDLFNLGVLKHLENDTNTISLDIKRLTEIMMSSSEGVLNAVEKIARPGSKVKVLTRRQRDCELLKQNLVCYNEELKRGIEGWIDGVYATPKGFLTNSSIEAFQSNLEEYTNGNLDLALKILGVASALGYREWAWVIKVFEKEYKEAYEKQHRAIKPHTYERNVKLSDEVF